LAGELLFAERLRLNTHRTCCVRTDQPVLSNVWWPFLPKGGRVSEWRVKSLALWANSTLGITLYLTCRVETEGAWTKFKKPSLLAMPVLDVSALPRRALDMLSKAYDKLCRESLGTLPEIDKDPVRAEMDKAICKALNLPDVSILRTLLAQEPIISLRRL
jgi:hypothetical protein